MKRPTLIIGWRTFLAFFIAIISSVFLVWKGHPYLTQVGRLIWICLVIWIGTIFDNGWLIRKQKKVGQNSILLYGFTLLAIFQLIFINDMFVAKIGGVGVGLLIACCVYDVIETKKRLGQ